MITTKMNHTDDWNNKHNDDGAQTTNANVDGPALLPSVGSKRARQAPPKSSTPQPSSLLPNPGTAHGSFLLSHIMIPLSFQTADPLSSQIVWPELHVAHDGPVHSWERQEECSGVEYNVPFREESCRSSCIYSGPLHSYNCDDVSQHPSTRAAAESNQLIYSGHALQALSDLARQFQCHPIFGREINLYAGKCHFTGKSIGDQPRSFANLDLLLFVQSTRVIDKAKVLCTFIIQLLEIYILITSWSWYILGSGVELN